MRLRKRVGLLLMLVAWCGPAAWGAAAPPKTAVEWFRRADELTNIRMPGAGPFHMKVTFHAYPGMDFAKKGKSEIITGDGTYEEWWLSPEKWRREVTFGSYHAVEVMGTGGRKFQASSSYEPSRVLMLLNALLTPVPRYQLEPELEKRRERPKWHLDHRRFVGGQAGVEVGYTEARCPSGFSWGFVYDLLNSGVLVRAVQYGLETDWLQQAAFGGKLVARRIEVHAVGLTLLSADVTVEPAGAVSDAEFDLPGDPAEPGATLRELQVGQTRLGHYTRLGRAELMQWDDHGDLQREQGSGVRVRAVYDQGGVPHEIEVTEMFPLIGPKGIAGMPDYLKAMAQLVLQGTRDNRLARTTVDGSRCEWVSGEVIAPGVASEPAVDPMGPS